MTKLCKWLASKCLCCHWLQIIIIDSAFFQREPLSTKALTFSKLEAIPLSDPHSSCHSACVCARVSVCETIFRRTHWTADEANLVGRSYLKGVWMAATKDIVSPLLQRHVVRQQTKIVTMIAEVICGRSTVYGVMWRFIYNCEWSNDSNPNASIGLHQFLGMSLLCSCLISFRWGLHYL